MEALKRDIGAICAHSEIESYYRCFKSDRCFKPDMERLSNAYIAEALGALGIGLDWQGARPTEELIAHAGIQAKYRRLLDCLMGHLATDGLVHKTVGGWECRGDGSQAPAARDLWRRLFEVCPQFQAELLLLQRCGPNLAAMLTGDADPLNLIFPPGAKTAAHFFQSSPTFDFYCKATRRLLAEAFDRIPAERSLRILEIGAGTGGLTATILPALPRHRTEYVFTDISSGFLNAAAKRFHEYNFIDYRLLDIAVAPAEQGYGEEKFDIVLASDAVHATADLYRSLANCRKLLADGGWLILLETTACPRWFDLVWGLLDGWWLFEDHERRPNHVLLGRDAWRRAFAQTGFRSAAVVPDPSTDADPLNSVLVAQAPAAQPATPPSQATSTRRDRPWLVFGDEGDLTLAVLQGRLNLGITPRLVTRTAIDGAITPANAAAALAALQLLRREPSRVAQLQDRARLFLDAATARGFSTGSSRDTAVIPIVTGRSEAAVGLYEALYDDGIYALPIMYPVVPEGAARLRFFVTCLHTEDQIRDTVDAIDRHLGRGVRL